MDSQQRRLAAAVDAGEQDEIRYPSSPSKAVARQVEFLDRAQATNVQTHQPEPWPGRGTRDGRDLWIGHNSRSTQGIDGTRILRPDARHALRISSHHGFAQK